MTASFSDAIVLAFAGGLTTLKTLVDKAASHAEDKSIAFGEETPLAKIDARLEVYHLQLAVEIEAVIAAMGALSRRIYDHAANDLAAEANFARRRQIGNGLRSGKIRTYR